MRFWVLVFLLGGAGAGLRTLVSLKVSASGVLATTLVNLTGCLLAGCLFGLTLSSQWVLKDPDLHRALVFGFLGALTTFSTFSVDAFRFVQAGDYVPAAAYLIGQPIAGLLMAGVGFWLTKSAATV